MLALRQEVFLGNKRNVNVNGAPAAGATPRKILYLQRLLMNDPRGRGARRSISGGE